MEDFLRNGVWPIPPKNWFCIFTSLTQIRASVAIHSISSVFAQRVRKLRMLIPWLLGHVQDVQDVQDDWDVKNHFCSSACPDLGSHTGLYGLDTCSTCISFLYLLGFTIVNCYRVWHAWPLPWWFGDVKLNSCSDTHTISKPWGARSMIYCWDVKCLHISHIGRYTWW